MMTSSEELNQKITDQFLQPPKELYEVIERLNDVEICQMRAKARQIDHFCTKLLGERNKK
ncbi:hypothetical protein R83H12_02555 [Fibrobacteria bacterium R8-3-H12]